MTRPKNKIRTSPLHNAPIAAPWRSRIGGMWEEIGRHQFEFLKARGLRPSHKLLDVGCGCLRGGVHFIAYLNDGNYYGIDSDESLLKAGKSYEIPAAGLSEKTVNLACRDDFAARNFGVGFDFALAQSVFTHLAWSSILRCLTEVSQVLTNHGQFFATFFEDKEGRHTTTPLVHLPAGVTTHSDRNPYHYNFAAFECLAHLTGLKVEYIGDWNHPRGQKMMVFNRRLDDPYLIEQSPPIT